VASSFAALTELDERFLMIVSMKRGLPWRDVNRLPS